MGKAVHLFLFVWAFWGSAWAQTDMAQAITRIKPSVVIVGTFGATDSPRFQLKGTGFAVGDGSLVVTNAHVVPEGTGPVGAPALAVQVRNALGDWQLRSASVVVSEPARDLAVLRIDGIPAPALVVGDSSRVQEGQSLGFMGFPIGGALGFSPVTHRAMVSAITQATLPSPTAQSLTERAVRSLRAGPFEFFQLDATAYPGNSGGPLFDPATGEVVGVMNMVFLKGTRESALSQPSGISYAVPSRYLRELLGQVK